jgi:hypothetical protein
MSGGRHTKVSARNGNNEVAVSTTTTDAPLLPIDQIERLKDIAPDRVEWLFDQTQIESENRRAENKRINTMLFFERIAGLVFALLVACAGLYTALQMALAGREVAASVVGGATLVGLVTAFIAGKRQQK